ncbi:MAG: sec-independent protein translocase protein TatA [Cellvibrionaceae bacterium]|jgi:sec-independent protein translocase protein TatA
MLGLGPWELGIILIIVIIIFGVGRISKLGGELGKSVSSFRQGLKEGMDENDDSDDLKNEKTDA